MTATKPLRKRLKHAVAFYVLLTFWHFLSVLPEGAITAFRRSLRWLLGRTHVPNAITQQLLLTNLQPPHEALVASALDHYACLCSEMVLLNRWQPRILEHWQGTQQTAALIKNVLSRGKGVVVATGHLGNWEFFARALAAEGLHVWTLAKAPANARLGNWLNHWRAKAGVNTANRGSRETITAVKEHLGKGGGLGVLVDVDTTVKSVWVPFLGRAAKTPTAAADLALRFGAPVVVAWSWRTGPGRFACHAVEIAWSEDAAKKAEVFRLTQAITQALEGAVTAHPAQWIWTHRRWKTPPPA